MKRRIILEVELPDDEPGEPLQLLTDLADHLEELKGNSVILDYGLALWPDPVRLVELKRDICDGKP